MTLASLRWILAAALAAPMFTSCGAAPKVVRATATDTPSTAMDRPGAARTPGDAFSLPRRQDDDVPFRQIHPNTMVTVSGLIGSADVEINAGPPTGIVSGSADAYGGRLRGEHIFGHIERTPLLQLWRDLVARRKQLRRDHGESHPDLRTRTP